MHVYKSPTTPDDPVRGVLDVLDVASADLGVTRDELLRSSELFVHATTRAINAIITGATARTAFLTTKGHPDVLFFREGGRTDPFDFTRTYPDPYVPRALTFELPERIGAAGEIVLPLDEQATLDVIQELQAAEVQAVAVCLLWSIVNPAHELRVGALLEQHLPGVPYTLSHALNPSLREYRRASSAAIDASLKPVMSAYLASLDERLREAGFEGRVLVVTSTGGVLDADAVAAAPIHSISSGPAMAPVAGRYYAKVDASSSLAVIADTGGTSYDVSLVRHGHIPWTRETWLGKPYEGDLTGFPSVDVKSIGAGGGSIAGVDDFGLLHVGPQSAGAEPGPVCYRRGGTLPTVTDASLVLGYLDPDYFLGGAMELDAEGAAAALEAHIGSKLGLDTYEAAAAVLQLATEHMVRAIEDITLNQGIDPRTAVLVGGGGAAGLNAVAIARRLGSPLVLIPDVGAVLSAAGALMSDLTAEYAKTFRTTTLDFDAEGANAVLAELAGRCRQFAEGPGAGAPHVRTRFSVEARYPHQVWDIEVPLRVDRFESKADVEHLRTDFHRTHRELFAIDDPASSVEIVGWRARVQCGVGSSSPARVEPPPVPAGAASRSVYFPSTGLVEARVRHFHALEAQEEVEGPAIVESPVTTVVIDPGAYAMRGPSGGLVVSPSGRHRETGAEGLAVEAAR